MANLRPSNWYIGHQFGIPTTLLVGIRPKMARVYLSKVARALSRRHPSGRIVGEFLELSTRAGLAGWSVAGARPGVRGRAGPGRDPAITAARRCPLQRSQFLCRPKLRAGRTCTTKAQSATKLRPRASTPPTGRPLGHLRALTSVRPPSLTAARTSAMIAQMALSSAGRSSSRTTTS